MNSRQHFLPTLLTTLALRTNLKQDNTWDKIGTKNIRNDIKTQSKR